jgi:hypothetical protein
MAGTAVVDLEGVLCKGSPPNGAPVWTGIQTYHALATQFRLVVDTAHDDITEIEHWLKVNSLNRHTLVLQCEPEEAALGPVELRQAHLAEWRAHGFDIALWVTSDPLVAASMMRAGITSLLFAHPQFARPEHRPDHESTLRPWDAIEEEITAQLALREQAPRIDAEMDYE